MLARSRFIVIVLMTLAIGIPSSQGQTLYFKLRYGNFPVSGAAMTTLKRDLARDWLILKTNTARCKLKKNIKKLSVCDADNDGLTNGREKVLRTNPLNKVTDRDGLTDLEELLK